VTTNSGSSEGQDQIHESHGAPDDDLVTSGMGLQSDCGGRSKTTGLAGYQQIGPGEVLCEDLGSLRYLDSYS
jgi:hypothetical protein